ncbi:MAG: TRAP transporter small permease [Planctomycetota bacterium]|jgi:TRAP-type C4-dicarboxylate transport system permease small subunit|nr:TRAP transporter small permease [Planctomycetota bacterium]
MKKTIACLQKLENLILALSFVVMSLSAFAQVVNRNLIGAGISWFEELARYCMVYMALLGTEIGLRDGSQIAITAIIDKFKGKGGEIIRILGKMVVVAFSAIIFWTSFTLLEKQVQFGQLSPGLEVPMYVPYAALPLSFGIITAVQGLTLILMLTTFLSGGKAGAAEGGAA